MKNIEYLRSLLKALPPDFDKIEEELKTNTYTPEEVTELVCNFAEECFCEYSNFIDDHKRVPLDEEIHSTYIYDICKLFLKYGFDPNMVLGEKYSESTIMFELRYIDKPYVSADTSRFLLDNGADPYLEIDGSTIFHDADIGVWFDITEGYAKEDYYYNTFDCRLHYWFVLLGYTDEEKSFLKEHEKYTARIVKTDEHHWDIQAVPKKLSDRIIFE